MRLYNAPSVAKDGIRNANTEFENLPQFVKDAFLTGMKNFGVYDNAPIKVPVQKVRLPKGFELYKFTEYWLKNQKGEITPWWSPLEDFGNDPGLEARKRLAKALGTTASELSGVYAAVREDWNAGTFILRAKLKRDVYAFFGQCAMQPRLSSPTAAYPVVTTRPGRVHGRTTNLPGFAWQLYIPTLTDADIGQVSRLQA
ncbi:hypothetical protein LJR030_005417 [Rhizobium sp. LjRoot30]|uniref:hypothetical protein n=1 Tax=Rhizobium sp. LjRoot30 TaxID=3342320 RepID=UPI003ECD8B8A